MLRCGSLSIVLSTVCKTLGLTSNTTEQDRQLYPNVLCNKWHIFQIPQLSYSIILLPSSALTCVFSLFETALANVWEVAWPGCTEAFIRPTTPYRRRGIS